MIPAIPASTPSRAAPRSSWPITMHNGESEKSIKPADEADSTNRKVSHAMTNAADGEAGVDKKFIIETAQRILAVIRAKGRPMSEAEIIRGLGKSRKPVAPDMIADLINFRVLCVAEYNGQRRGMFWFGPAMQP
jgi:hypothetical protein